MLTLALTSSTAMVGVAVADGLTILASDNIVTDRRHAEELTPMVASVLAAAATEIGDIEVFAVDVGPGRFTGLRVGITTARTLALATGRQIVPVTSLEALAKPIVSAEQRNVVAVIDARRGEVFIQRFAADASEPASDPTYLSPADASALIKPGDIVVGDGLDRYQDELQLAEAEPRLGHQPMPEAIAALAVGREALEGPEVLPLYLRAPDVQVNIKTRNNT